MKKLNKPVEITKKPIGEWVVKKNNQFIVFNKPPTLPIQEDKTQDKCLLQLAEIYTKQNLFLCNRIDRPASGLVVFAKTKKALAHINNQLKNREISKTYLAVVKAPIENKNAHLENLLEKNQTVNKSFIVTSESKHSKKAELKYKTIASSDNYVLLEIDLITGRHHQIRAQLAHIGFPIKGDVKYGARRSNKDKSIHLHAWKMKFKHPISGETVDLVSEVPDEPLWEFFKGELQKIQST